MPSRKRPAAASGAESGLSQQTPRTSGLATQRADDSVRAGQKTRQKVQFASPNSHTAADVTKTAFPDLSFPTSMQDIFPVDLSRATPESTSTESSRQRQLLSPSLGVHGAHNPVNKLDSLMFPSDDPFAYPNQPMIELGFQPKADGPSVPMVGPGQDTPFFFPTSFDEIGNQLLSYPSPYLMQQQQEQQQQQQQLFGLAGNPYDAHSMLAMHTVQQQQQQQQQPYAQPQLHMQSHTQAQAQPQPHEQGQQRSGVQQQRFGGIFSGFRRARADRQQVRQIEQMFTQQGMQPDWGSFFGSGRGGFQGM